MGHDGQVPHSVDGHRVRGPQGPLSGRQARPCHPGAALAALCPPYVRSMSALYPLYIRSIFALCPLYIRALCSLYVRSVSVLCPLLSAAHAALLPAAFPARAAPPSRPAPARRADPRSNVGSHRSVLQSLAAAPHCDALSRAFVSALPRAPLLWNADLSVHNLSVHNGGVLWRC